jgi:nicotinate-nucleotide pyrophosphorylase
LDLGTEAAGFAQRFLVELNASNSSDQSEKALKLLADLVQLDDFQPSMLFYSNDLRVLGDILNQQLRDTASLKVENPSLSRHFAETRIDRPGLGAIAIA